MTRGGDHTRLPPVERALGRLRVEVHATGTPRAGLAGPDPTSALPSGVIPSEAQTPNLHLGHIASREARRSEARSLSDLDLWSGDYDLSDLRA